LLQCYPDAIRTKTIGMSPISATDGPSSKHRFASLTRRQQQQLPIHILCQHCHGRIHPDVILLLLQYYPMSMQMHDSYGYTALMYLCGNPCIGNIVEIVSVIIKTTMQSTTNVLYQQNCPCTILRSVTNTDAMEYILHIACTYHVHHPDLIQLFIDADPMLCEYTNMKFQLPIHTAIISFCQYIIKISTATIDATIHSTSLTDNVAMNIHRMLETIQLLIETYPAALQWRDDEHDETPSMIATRMLLSSRDNSNINATKYNADSCQMYYQQLQDLLIV
jgi:hypothetical protein